MNLRSGFCGRTVSQEKDQSHEPDCLWSSYTTGQPACQPTGDIFPLMFQNELVQRFSGLRYTQTRHSDILVWLSDNKQLWGIELY